MTKPFAHARSELTLIADYQNLSGTKRATLTLNYIFHVGHGKRAVKRWIRQRSFGSLPTVIVFVVVLISGSRLIYLSVQHHAAIARDTAATVAAGFVSKIEPPLQKLADLAGRQAATATEALSSTHPFSALGPVAPAPNTFWMTADDKVLGARTEEAVTASGIASEWQSAESARAAPGSAILGPMRLGSEWLVAIRDPIARARRATAVAGLLGRLRRPG